MVPSIRNSTHESTLRGGLLAVFSLATVLVALGLATMVLRTGLASSFTTANQGRYILRFDRDDGLLEDRLGQMYSDTNPAEGIRHFQRAIALSPLNRHYHADLASECESLGNTACADSEWELLARLCPMVPVYQSHAAQAYLRSSHLDKAVFGFEHLLKLDPAYGPESWFALRAVLDPDAIFTKTIPENAAPEVKLSYVVFLSNQGDNDSAFRIWQRVVDENHPFPFSAAKPYLERLLDLARIGEAESVWHGLQRLRIVATPARADAADLIFNGDFEQLPINAGFDWRWPDPNAYLAIDFAAPGAYHGMHCLRIDFTVSRNEEYEPVAEFVRVFPNRSYRVEAYVRSEDITSDSGPRLRVSDTQFGSFPDVVSETIVGTTTWHPLRLDFSTGSQTQFIELSVWRPRGRLFPTEISGTFWMDQVSLKDIGPAASENAAGRQ